LSNGLNIPVHLKTPPEARAASPKRYRLRPVVALLGLMLIGAAALLGIASSSVLEQPGAAMLFSCAPCHD
jgi:hypothetical protein